MTTLHLPDATTHATLTEALRREVVRLRAEVHINRDTRLSERLDAAQRLYAAMVGQQVGEE